MLSIKKQRIEKKSLSVCKLHCIIKKSFKSAFNEDAIDLTSPIDTVPHQFNDELHKELDTIAPLKEIQVAVCQRQPRFDEIFKARHKVVRNRKQISHKYPKPDMWKAYQMERNAYNRLFNYKKKQLNSKQVTDSKGNNRKLYKLTAHVAGINTDNPLPFHDSDESLANHFADYFISKIDKICENFIGIPAFAPEVTDAPIFKKFVPLTPSQVTKLVADMQTKSRELHMIPTHVLK